MSDFTAADGERLSFQHDAHTLRDALKPVLGEAYGGVWLDWNGDVGRLKVAVTTRCGRSTMTVAEQLIDDSPINGRVDLVPVIWSARELSEGQERLVEALRTSVGAVSMISANAKLNSVVVWAVSAFSQADLDSLRLAIQTAGVSVQVVVNDVRWQAAESAQPVEVMDVCDGVAVALAVHSYESDDGDGLLLTYELANRAPTPALYGAEFGLDQFVDSRWVSVNVATTWPAIGYRIRPRQRRVGSCRLPPGLPDGLYRLHKEVGVEIAGAKERGDRPLHQRFRLTADFTIS